MPTTISMDINQYNRIVARMDSSIQFGEEETYEEHVQNWYNWQKEFDRQLKLDNQSQILQEVDSTPKADDQPQICHEVDSTPKAEDQHQLIQEIKSNPKFDEPISITTSSNRNCDKPDSRTSCHQIEDFHTPPSISMVDASKIGSRFCRTSKPPLTAAEDSLNQDFVKRKQIKQSLNLDYVLNIFEDIDEQNNNYNRYGPAYYYHELISHKTLLNVDGKQYKVFKKGRKINLLLGIEDYRNKVVLDGKLFDDYGRKNPAQSVFDIMLDRGGKNARHAITVVLAKALKLFNEITNRKWRNEKGVTVDTIIYELAEDSKDGGRAGFVDALARATLPIAKLSGDILKWLKDVQSNREEEDDDMHNKPTEDEAISYQHAVLFEESCEIAAMQPAEPKCIQKSIGKGTLHFIGLLNDGNIHSRHSRVLLVFKEASGQILEDSDAVLNGILFGCSSACNLHQVNAIAVAIMVGKLRDVLYINPYRPSGAESSKKPTCKGSISRSKIGAKDVLNEPRSKLNLTGANSQGHTTHSLHKEDLVAAKNAECEIAASPGQLMFEYLEREPPDGREPLAYKISALAFKFSQLGTYNSCDIRPSSWVFVAWYPNYRIPTGSTLQNLDVCFLTFDALSKSSKTISADKFAASCCFQLEDKLNFKRKGEDINNIINYDQVVDSKEGRRASFVDDWALAAPSVAKTRGDILKAFLFIFSVCGVQQLLFLYPWLCFSFDSNKTKIGGKNGEPKQTISYMAKHVVGWDHLELYVRKTIKLSRCITTDSFLIVGSVQTFKRCNRGAIVPPKSKRWNSHSAEDKKQLNRVKLKVDGVVRRIHVKSSSNSVSVSGLSLRASETTCANQRLTLQKSDEDISPTLNDSPANGKKVDSVNSGQHEPLRKSKCAPKRCIIKEIGDDSGDELRYLEGLKTSRLTADYGTKIENVEEEEMFDQVGNVLEVQKTLRNRANCSDITGVLSAHEYHLGNGDSKDVELPGSLDNASQSYVNNGMTQLLGDQQGDAEILVQTRKEFLELVKNLSLACYLLGELILARSICYVIMHSLYLITLVCTHEPIFTVSSLRTSWFLRGVICHAKASISSEAYSRGNCTCKTRASKRYIWISC